MEYMTRAPVKGWSISVYFSELCLVDSDLALIWTLRGSLHWNAGGRGPGTGGRTRITHVHRFVAQTQTIFFRFDESPENGNLHIQSNFDILEEEKM